ncbi:MAG: tetratricopeptide repeat protein [Bacteroidia bacterium]
MRTITYFMWLFLALIIIGVGFWVLNQKYGSNKRNYEDLYNMYSKPCLNYWTTDTGFIDTSSMAFLAMSYYDKKNYQLALEAFQRYEPQANEEAFYNFYIGLCYLYTNFNNLAINHLEISLSLFKDFTKIHLARWYLGLAYLKSNQIKEATEQFKEIVKMNAQFRTQANELLEEIERRRNPFKIFGAVSIKN